MPNNRRCINGKNDYSNAMTTCQDVISSIRSATNKNDAIRDLQNMKIGDTDTAIGSECAHKIYDTYSKYRGGGYRRNRRS